MAVIKQKVLVVDDLPANIKAMEILLKELDIEVITALSGNEGLAKTIEHEFAIILLDVNMPEMDGFEMAEILRTNPGTSSTPIIFVTAAYDDEITLLRGYDVGAVDYIEKPINKNILLSKIKVFLELDKSQKEMENLLATLEERVEEKTKSLIEEIEERKKAEESSNKSAARLSAIVNTASEGICMFDDSGIIKFWNSGCTQILGYEEKEALSMPLETIIPIDNENSSNKELYNIYGSEITTPSPSLILTALRKDGNNTPIELSLTGWAEGDGWNHVAIFRDVGERISYQNALEKAANKANEANLAKTQFLANMSHELRTPLNAIIGFSELILNHRLKDLKAEEVEEDINIIHSSGQHLLALINEVLDISKVEAGKMELNNWPVDIPPLVNNACQVSEKLIKDQNNKMIINCPDDIQVMNMDPKLMKQILMNLISNAAKFTRDGTITVNVKQRLEDNALWTAFEIIDTGIGIKEDAIARVFDRFSQVDNSNTRHHQGTGLGLALVKTFSEFMGGGISLTSVYGEGSTFVVDIPDGDPQEIENNISAEAG
jgi:PAS domain S-box-containing protein